MPDHISHSFSLPPSFIYTHTRLQTHARIHARACAHTYTYAHYYYYYYYKTNSINNFEKIEIRFYSFHFCFVFGNNFRQTNSKIWLLIWSIIFCEWQSVNNGSNLMSLVGTNLTRKWNVRFFKPFTVAWNTSWIPTIPCALTMESYTTFQKLVSIFYPFPIFIHCKFQ